MEDLNFQNVNFTEPTPAANFAEETPTLEKKRGRGRPKKGETPINSAPKERQKESQQEKTGLDLMDDMQRQIEANEIREEGPQGSPITQAAKNIIDGYMLLTVCDTFFPWLFKMFYKKAKEIKDKDIRLSKDQKEHMAPLADEIAAASLSFMDPTTLFFILMGSIYKQNIDDAVQKQIK